MTGARAMSSLAGLVLPAALLLSTSASAAEQFRVNTYGHGTQMSPAVAVDDSGEFVVVWTTLQGEDGSSTLRRILGRRVGPGGVATGVEFPVDEDLSCGPLYLSKSCSRERPAVARAAPSGEFVVSWKANAGIAYESYEVVRSRRFGPGAVPLGPEILVGGGSNQVLNAEPAVTVNPDGSSVFTWIQAVYSNGSWIPRVYARRYDSSGDPLGPLFQVASGSSGFESAPAIAPGLDGGFIVTWHSRFGLGSDSSGTGIQARRFDSAGIPLGPEFQVNTETLGRQFRSVVGSDAAGNFVVAWDSWAPSSGEVVSRPSVRARRFDAAGAPLGPEFLVNEPATGFPGHPALAVEPDGDFVVAWSANGGVFARRFGADGQPRDRELQIVSVGTALPTRPAIAVAPNGDFLVAWMGYLIGGASKSVDDIHARLITSDWLYSDGFENGDAARWSAIAP